MLADSAAECEFTIVNGKGEIPNPAYISVGVWKAEPHALRYAADCRIQEDPVRIRDGSLATYATRSRLEGLASGKSPEVDGDFETEPFRPNISRWTCSISPVTLGHR